MPTFTYFQNFDNLGPGFPAGWNTGNFEGSPYFSVTELFSYSGNFSLSLTEGSQVGGPCLATFGTGDGSGSAAVNLTLSSDLLLEDPTNAGQFRVGMVFRGNSSTLDDASTTFYSAYISAVLEGAHQSNFLYFSSFVNGVETILGSVFAGNDVFTGNWINITITFQGGGGTQNSIAIQLHEYSTGSYLTSSGTWQELTPANAISQAAGVCDNTITSGAYTGVIAQAYENFAVYLDDFSIDSVSTPFGTSVTGLGLQGVVSANALHVLTATTFLNVTDTGLPTENRLAAVGASTFLNVTDTGLPTGSKNQQWFGSSITTLNLIDDQNILQNVAWPVSLSTTLSVTDTGLPFQNRLAAVASATTINLADDQFTNAGNNAGVYSLQVAVNINVTDTGLPFEGRITASAAVDGFQLKDAIDPNATPQGVGVVDGFRLTASASQSSLVSYLVVAIDNGISLSALVSESDSTNWLTGVLTTVTLSAAIGTSMNRQYAASSIDTFSLTAPPAPNISVAAAAVDSVNLSVVAGESQNAVDSLSAGVGLQAVVTAGRDVYAGVVDGIGLSGPDDTPFKFNYPTLATGVGLSASPSLVVGWPGSSDTIGLIDFASVSLYPAGISIGQTVLSGIDAQWPLSFAPTPDGNIVMANGVDPMILWQSLPGIANYIGVPPPSTNLSLGGVGVGVITGRRTAFCRFYDGEGNYSALSPGSNMVNFGWERPIDNILIAANGQASVAVLNHNLVTGDAVVLRDVGGLPYLSGTVTVTVLDPDNFTVNGISIQSGSIWQGGGSFVYGIAQVVYSNVPLPTDNAVVGRQILRNLEGTLDVLYVDVDTQDLVSTTFTSSQLDDSLRQQESVPLFDQDGQPWANKFLPPPSEKPLLASYMGRIWAAGDVSYATGCVLPITGSNTIQGVGTAWKTTFVGRQIYISGARQAYGILAVDTVNQILTLTDAIQDAGLNQFSIYTIRSAPLERKMIYYSDPGDPTAWPPGNALAVPDDEDEVVGIMQHGQALVVIEKQHIYRIVCRGEPQKDANCFLMAYRGCVHGRLAVQVEGYIYMLDEGGVHRYDGSATCEEISQEIQTVFQSDGITTTYQIDWTSPNRGLWNASYDPTRTTVRWNIDFIGQPSLQNSLCYNYRTQAWWLEYYSFAATSSCTGTIGYRRAIVGADVGRVICLSESQSDLVDPTAGTVRGNPDSATSNSITDSTAAFSSAAAGAPITIVDGTGRSQEGVVTAVTPTTVSWFPSWPTTPDTTSVYQIGGIDWTWLSGWMDVVDSEADTERDLVLTYQPTNYQTFADVQLYYDHALEPMTWGFNWAADGMEVELGNPWIMFDFHQEQLAPGYRVMRIHSHHDKYAYGDRYLQVLMTGTTNGGVVRIYQVALSGVAYETGVDEA